MFLIREMIIIKKFWPVFHSEPGWFTRAWHLFCCDWWWGRVFLLGTETFSLCCFPCINCYVVFWWYNKLPTYLVRSNTIVAKAVPPQNICNTWCFTCLLEWAWSFMPNSIYDILKYNNPMYIIFLLHFLASPYFCSLKHNKTVFNTNYSWLTPSPRLA